jgi:hypothetical protein
LFTGLLAITYLGALGAMARPVHHSLSISLFPPDNSLLATDSIYVNPAYLEDGNIEFLINKALTVENISSNAEISSWYTEEDVEASLFKDEPDSEDVEFMARAKGVFVEFAGSEPLPERIAIVISYAGVINDSLRAPPKAYARGFGETTGLIQERGIYLTNESLWYPYQFGRMFTFDLQANVPYGWMTVSQGHLADEFTGHQHDEERVFDRWIEENPTPEFYLVAGKYYRHQDYHDGTWVMTYTFEESDSLSRVYVDATKRYLALYESLLGDYPFGKFALVENFWQTGYGMPSFTLLGSKVIRLPFIVHTSYGHEILHNWWGNSVYVDYSSGNWCEGLTTYGADYLYKEQIGQQQARDYRHNTLVSFTNYVTEGKDFPLTGFHERHDAASQSVGYGKSLMVYHMLRRSLGDSLFWACLREFYARSRFAIASWRDIEKVFGEVTGEDLSWYFDQWLNRTGAPTIRLGHTDVARQETDYDVTFTLEQDMPSFTIDVPVEIETTHGTEATRVRLTGPDSTYTIRTRAEPVRIAIDPDYDMFRKLYIEEIPITLGALFGQDSVLVVIGSAESDTAKALLRQVADAWGLSDYVVNEDEVEPDRISHEHTWLLGRGSMLNRIIDLKRDQVEIDGQAAQVAGSEFGLEGNTLICALRNPHNEHLAIGAVITEDLSALMSLASRIPHYSSYSYLGFAGGRPTLKGVWPERASPLAIDFKGR